MKDKALKVMTIVGTRPEIIRLSRVIPRLDEFTNHILVHTGQNYDYELNEIFFDELELRKPDHFLNIDTSSLGASVGDIMRKSEEVLLKEKPDALLVLGDTNSCLAAYMAKRMHIPIFHMEAGNRSFDFNVPEETNRRIIDHIADFNLVYTEHARRHLLSEGQPHRRIYLTGSPMKEVLDYYKPKIDQSGILEKLNLEPKKYFVVSIHREENVDNPQNLEKIVQVLKSLVDEYKLPLIISTHPRARKRLESKHPSLFTHHPSPITHHSSLHFHKPFGFPDYIHLQQNALCTISDSGTISEESANLGFPAISLRQSMERPEAQDTGSIILTGFEPEIVLSSVITVISELEQKTIQHLNGSTTNQLQHSSIPTGYTITNTSWRVLKLILGNARLSNKWWGVESR